MTQPPSKVPEDHENIKQRLPQTKHLLAVGSGYVARALAPSLIDHGFKLSGTTRSTSTTSSLSALGISPLIWPQKKAYCLFKSLPAETITHILISTPPNEHGCPAAQLADLMAQLPALKLILYLSSSGVYGNHDGGWVDEKTPPQATTPRGVARIKAENFWRAWAANKHIPIQIHRLSGIYGPGRNALRTLERRDDLQDRRLGQRVLKKGQVFNRIHVADIVAILEKCILKEEYLDRTKAEKMPMVDIFNHADDMPASPQDVLSYAATLLNVPVPPLIPYESATLSPMARSFYADNKRVINKKIKLLLGGALQFPTYKEGLKAILETPEYSN